MNKEDSELISVRKIKPTKKNDGAEVVFVRKDGYGRRHRIYACRNKHGSYEQWNATTPILCDNQKTVEKWYNGELI